MVEVKEVRERENIRNMDAFSFEPFHYCSNAANVLIFRARSSRLIRPDGRFRFRGIPSISFRKCFVLFTHRRDGGGPSSCLIRSRYRPDFQCFFFLSFQLAVDPLGLVRSVRFLCRCVFTEFCFRVVPSLGHGRSFSFFGRPENCTGGRRTKKTKKNKKNGSQWRLELRSLLSPTDIDPTRPQNDRCNHQKYINVD